LSFVNDDHLWTALSLPAKCHICGSGVDPPWLGVSTIPIIVSWDLLRLRSLQLSLTWCCMTTLISAQSEGGN
jgi:hypothetical protein